MWIKNKNAVSDKPSKRQDVNNSALRRTQNYWIKMPLPRQNLLDLLGPSASVLDIISAADVGRRPMETLPESTGQISEKGFHSLPCEILTMVMFKTFSDYFLSLWNQLTFALLSRSSPSSPGVTWDQLCWLASGGRRWVLSSSRSTLSSPSLTSESSP